MTVLQRTRDGCAPTCMGLHSLRSHGCSTGWQKFQHMPTWAYIYPGLTAWVIVQAPLALLCQLQCQDATIMHKGAARARQTAATHAEGICLADRDWSRSRSRSMCGALHGFGNISRVGGLVIHGPFAVSCWQLLLLLLLVFMLHLCAAGLCTRRVDSQLHVNSLG